MNDNTVYLGRNKIHDTLNMVDINQKGREERKAAGEQSDVSTQLEAMRLENTNIDEAPGVEVHVQCCVYTL